MQHIIIFTLIVVCFIVDAQLPVTLQKNVLCGHSSAEYISLGETHLYQLALDGVYDVNFQTCASETDIIIVVNDDNDNDISDTWCSDGDSCGSCPNADNYPEDFTIPFMTAGTYFIDIHAYEFGDPGNYQLDISCVPNTDDPPTQPPTSKLFVQCDEVISSIFSGSESHFYQFSTSDTYNIHFDSCNSDIDIIVNVTDLNGNSLSDQYCSGGDWCGSCDNNALYAENFVIPSIPLGSYIVKINPFGTLGGLYSYAINCSAHSNTNSTSNPTTTSYLSTQLYTTSVASDCDYHYDPITSISPAQKVFDSITIHNDTIEIVFDIRINEYCNRSLCNIFFIHSNSKIGDISLSINGILDYFEISITTGHNFNDVHKIPNAKLMLPTDGQYHKINMTYSYGFSDKEHNRNVFKIDNIVHVFHSTLLIIPNRNYELYMSSPSEPSVNASVSNICIQSLALDLWDYFSGEMRCGNRYSGKLNSKSDIDFYFFNIIDDATSVLFDSCSSSYDTYLYLFDIETNLIKDGDDDGDCSNREQLLIDNLSPGSYFIAISGYGTPLVSHAFGDWVIDVKCGNLTISSNNETVDEYYILLDSVSAIMGRDAQTVCEREVGTSLATIITSNDWDHAKYIVSHHFEKLLSYADKINLRIWIGLYKDTTNASWEWIDETSCNYTTSGKCIDDIHWHQNQPDGLPATNFGDQQFGAVMFIPELYIGNTNFSAYYDDQPWTEPLSLFDTLILCNTPNSKYTVPTCTKHINCWSFMECCDDSVVDSDTSAVDVFGQPFVPPIAYWDSKLFVVGEYEIHMTKFNLLNIEYNWSYFRWKTANLSAQYLAQRYSQYKSLLYLYSYQEIGDVLPDTLIQIDLDTLNITHFPLPNNFPTINEFGTMPERYCMVSSKTHIYVIRYRFILIYSLVKQEWSQLSTSDFDDGEPITCAITNDKQFVYIFSQRGYLGKINDKVVYGSMIVKFNTNTTSFETLNTPNLCSMNALYVKAITGRDGRIYLQGCYIGSWRTLIFNPSTQDFEPETIDIDIPTIKGVGTRIGSYRSGQMAVLDDNILLLLDKTYMNFYDVSVNDSLSAYYTITYLISFNFEDTIIDYPIWPSEGFNIKYNVNDFVNYNSTNNIYKMSFHSDSTATAISSINTLNTINDNCICETYKCYNCSHQFDLKNHLTIYDNEVDQLKFVPHLIGSEDVTLIIPNAITIFLQRCIISFSDFQQSVTEKDPAINFRFKLSQNCYLKPIANYCLNISSSTINLSLQLIINIVNNKTTTKLCRMNNNINCTEFDGNAFIIYHKIVSEENKRFNLVLVSNMIDFRVNASNNNTLQFVVSDKKFVDKINQKLLHLLWLLILPIIGGVIVFTCCRKQYKNAFIVDNALVAIIGISQFDDKTKHLPGVMKNVKDLTSLWKEEYNYDVFICNQTTLYSKKIDVINFVDVVVNKLADKPYKCCIFHIISHGSDDSFVTSEGKDVNIQFVRHEIVEKSEELDRTELIKLIFHHGCRGNVDFHIGKIAEISVEVEEKGKEDFDIKHRTRAAFNMDGVIDNNQPVDITFDANTVTISGNIKGRAISDSGYFTDCICESFQNNLDRMVKANFGTLIAEIGRNLEKKTKHAELCNINGTLRYNPIRFERCNDVNDKVEPNIELQSIPNRVEQVLEIVDNNDGSQMIIGHDITNQTDMGINQDEIDELMKDIDAIYDVNQSVTMEGK
eukprot:328771_1